jgi:hypothetical protein
MNRDRNAHRPTRAAKHERNLAGIDAKTIASMVAAGRPNPFAVGSREHIAYGWTKELLRHAESDKPTELADQARRIFPKAEAGTRRAVGAATKSETPSTVPPVPDENPRRPSLNNPSPLPSTKPEVPKTSYGNLWRPSELLGVSQEFADAIDEAENSHGRWNLASNESTAVGRYQILASGLRDIGLMDADGSWYGYPKPDREEFLQTPELQNLAFAAYLNRKLRSVKSLKLTAEDLEDVGLVDLVGREIDGVGGTFKVTLAGLVAAAHREGEGRLQQYLDHLATHDWYSDSETFPLDEIPGNRTKKQAFEQIEKRLREFMTVPLYGNHYIPPLNDPEDVE